MQRLELRDSYGRGITDLRISVTDRCNFRCFYCKTPHSLHYADRDQILSYEEIVRLAGLFVEMGIRKLRVTGGEPLLRRGLERLIELLAGIPGVEDLALTTNGFNFFEKAEALKRAGLRRVTISLDSLQPERFRAMTGYADLDRVLCSIDRALELDFRPVKVNCVVVRGVNDDEVEDFVRFAREREVAVRFIEFMPLDEDEQWSRERVVTGAEILERVKEQYGLRPLQPASPAETSRNYGFPEGRGSIGVITTISNPFCGACSRIRLTADGKIRTCLFSMVEHDVRGLLRNGMDDEGLRRFIRDTVNRKEPGHRINEPDFVPPPRSMSYIGG